MCGLRARSRNLLSLEEQFGAIDIYLFDQLLRGRIQPGMRIFDAGCGFGRNLVYFLREGYDVWGVDSDVRAIAALRALAGNQFHAESLEDHSFPSDFADLVISSAVLHFAADDGQFSRMLWATWRVLKPGGLFFCRLASSIGIEQLVVSRGGNRFLLPDGSERYLVNEERLMKWTADLNGELLDPLKTSVVQNQRSMTTWVMRKRTGETACPTLLSEES